MNNYSHVSKVWLALQCDPVVKVNDVLLDWVGEIGFNVAVIVVVLVGECTYVDEGSDAEATKMGWDN